MNDERFSFRWGIPWLDAGFLQVPNFFFKHYSELGISKEEFLFILHLAVYKFESPQGVACPALTTIARQMGVSKRQVQRLRESLEGGGWMSVRRRIGDTSLYDFQAFSLAMMRLEAVAMRSMLPSSGLGGMTPMSPPPHDIYVTPPHDAHVTPPMTPMSPPHDAHVTLRTNNKEEKPQQQGVVVGSSPTAEDGERGVGQEVVEPSCQRVEGADQDPGGAVVPADPEVADGHQYAWELNGALQDLGLGQEQGARLLERYGLERIREVLLAVSAREDAIRDPAAWVVMALKNGYTFPVKPAGTEEHEGADRERMRCAWVRNSGLGVCPSREAKLPLFAWCEQCEKLGGG